MRLTDFIVAKVFGFIPFEQKNNHISSQHSFAVYIAY